MKALLLGLLLVAACGTVLPQASFTRTGMLESYGFRCECGSHLFDVISRSFNTYRVRCARCRAEWTIRNPDK